MYMEFSGYAFFFFSFLFLSFYSLSSSSCFGLIGTGELVWKVWAALLSQNKTPTATYGFQGKESDQGRAAALEKDKRQYGVIQKNTKKQLEYKKRKVSLGQRRRFEAAALVGS